VGVLLAVAAMTVSCSSGDGKADGPLSGSQPGEVHQPVEVGQVVTVGYAELVNEGKTDARVEQVRLLPPGRVELVGVETLVLPRDGGGIISLPEYPPRDYPTKPLLEQNVVAAKKPRASGEPEPALELILGVRTARPGVFRSDEVEVTYVVGKRRFVERYPVQIMLCAPFNAHPAGCVQNGG
jgi:hypothetical protein